MYTPTYITKLNDKYFIVDCYHHRVIYTDDINNEIGSWTTVDYEFAGCHSIASDGELYVIENAGYNEVIVLDQNLKFKQKFKNVGTRPHRTIYDSESQAFYVIDSPKIICFKKIGGVIVKQYEKTLTFIADSYVRSIKIIDSKMYFVSGQSKIVAANYLDESYSIINEYPVPNELVGMNDIAKIGSYYYITSTANNVGEVVPKAVRVTSLSQLITSSYEDVYATIGFTGTPYFISVFDNRVYIPEIQHYINSIFSFSVDDVALTSIKTNFKFEGLLDASVKRREMYPL